jgi:hypothetical protein
MAIPGLTAIPRKIRIGGIADTTGETDFGEADDGMRRFP